MNANDKIIHFETMVEYTIRQGQRNLLLDDDDPFSVSEVNNHIEKIIILENIIARLKSETECEAMDGEIG